MAKNFSNEDLIELTVIVDCVKGHMERAGYQVSIIANKFGIGVNIEATKEREKFFITVIGEKKEASETVQAKELLFAIGETVSKMKEPNAWTFYAIAIPKNYLNSLKEWEVGGIQLIDFHFFIVESIFSLYHLDSKSVIELIQSLKTGVPENLLLLDIDFKSYDYII